MLDVEQKSYERFKKGLLFLGRIRSPDCRSCTQVQLYFREKFIESLNKQGSHLQRCLLIIT